MRWVRVPLLIVGLVVTAGAGEIVLKNGNRIAGELANDTILVSTGSDVIEIAPDQIAVLTPDEIRLRDGRVIHGTLVGGGLKARTALGELAVKVDEITEFRGDTAPAAPTAASPTTAPPAPGTPPAVPAAGQETPTAASPPSPQGAAEGSTGPTQVSQGASKIGQGVKETATGVGQAVVEGADWVHDGAKSIGLSIWEAMKSVGRTFKTVFGGSS